MPILNLNELPDTQLPDAESPDAEFIEKEPVDEGNPETNEPFNDDLIKLRSLMN